MKKTKRLEFPEVTDAELAFGRYPDQWFNKVLKDAAKNGYDQKYTDKASMLFFRGGDIEINENLDKEYTDRGVRILKCVLKSFTPKHEHKEIVAGIILKALEGKNDTV